MIAPDIAALRMQIDALDDALLGLVQQRTALAGAVAAAKAAAGDAASPFRPAREVQIIRRLIAKAPDLPPRLVGAIWRALIGANLAAQGGLRILATPAVADVARLRFGAIFEPEVCAPEIALAEAAEHGAVAVLPWPDAQARWWTHLTDPAFAELQIVAAAPILKLAAPMGLPRAVLVCAAPPEPAGEDVTLFLVPNGPATPGFVVDRAEGVRLIAVDGFHETLAALDGVRRVGAFAFA
jgi:chorismate mutase